MVAHNNATSMGVAADVIEAFTDIVGAESVLLQSEQLAEFHDPYEGPDANTHRPCLVIQPANITEIQACLRLANDLRVPLWTSSMGRNFGYGGSAPVVDMTVVMNLRRMNAIIEINADQGYALIEPGVTFFQLYEALRAQDVPLMMSVPDLGWGSMVANALQHGLGYNVMGDHASALCGLEVVLANGDVLRTGQGAIDGSPLWNTHKRGFGPSLDELFMQSNLGIVTKAGIRLAPRPETILCGTVQCQADDDIRALIDTMRPLLRDGVLQGVPMIVGTPNTPDGAPVEEGDTPFTLANLKKVLRPGRWNVRFGLYGRQAMVDARLAILKDALADIDGAVLEMRSYPGDAGPDAVDPRDYITAGIPNMVLLDRLNAAFGPKFGHQDFSPVLPLTGQAGLDYDAIVRDVMAKYKLIGPVGMMLRDGSMTGASMIMFDKTDAAQVAKTRAAVLELCERVRHMGCIPYRAHIAVVDKVAAMQDFNDGAMLRTVQTLKAALDPNGILAPGNHGIWPIDTV